MDIGQNHLSPTHTMVDALAAINRLDGSTCLVLDADGRLVGTVSDGDVRRALLRGQTLATPVADVMHRNPIIAPVDMSQEKLLELMQSSGIRDIPLVDKAGKLVAIRTLKELLSGRVRNNWIVLMAGGEGRRLRPLTENTPKPMLEIDGRPILESIIRKLSRQGFRRFYLSVNYLAHVVKEHFEYGDRLGIEIRYLEESKPLGTGGALALITERPTDPMVVMNSDVLTNLDVGRMVDYHTRIGAFATVGVRNHEFQVPYGVFTTDGEKVVSFQEKPAFTYSINAGVYVVDPATLDFVIRDEPINMPDIIERCLRRSCIVSAYQITEAWLDIGEHSEFERAKRDARLFL